jgi:5-(carboxyamino)imidazole ribonucleotide synthase
VTLEIEQIHIDVLDAVAAITTLRPGRAPVYVIQERTRQKAWLAEQQFPVGPFAVAASAADLAEAVRTLGRSIAKSTEGGYDGRGQARVETPEDAPAAWDTLGQRRCLVEALVDIDFEISVLVARRADGAMTSYPASRNHHTRGVLTWAMSPALVPELLAAQADALARAIAERLGIVGLLAVECFVTRTGALLVNELAPRPHNTFHHTERGAATSQFEQLVRTVCDLPFGSVETLAPAALVNLLGDAWIGGHPPDTDSALSDPRARLHVYGKHSARAGRKMGHLSAIGDTPSDALARALAAYRTFAPHTRAHFDVEMPQLSVPSSLHFS